jgi:hypothetical protein
MPYTTLGKHQMLKALKGTNPTTPITHVGLLDEGTALTAVTGVNSTDTLTKTGHGLSNGNLVVLRSKTGGSGVKEEYPYFVVGVAGDDFQLSEEPGGTATDLGSDISAVTVVPLAEISGGTPAYARQSITFADPAEGVMDDTDNGIEFDVPAGTVNYSAYYSASSGGALLAIRKQTAEVYGAQGSYLLLDVKLDLNQDVIPA